MDAHSKNNTLWRSIIALLSLVAFGLSLWLTVEKLRGNITTLAGCGAGSGCSNVLGSKWSMVFGVVPVSVCSGLLYLGIVISLLLRSMTAIWLRQLAAWVIIGAAIWFTILQIEVLKNFCKYCMSMHGVGVLLALTILLTDGLSIAQTMKRSVILIPAALVFVASLAVVQYLAPEHLPHRVEILTVDLMEGDVHAEGRGRVVTLFGEGKRYRVGELPHVGRPDAQYVLVKYFDYTCDACQKMHHELDELIAKYPQQITVIVLPVPLNENCNPYLPRGVVNHEKACEFAGLALRVWKADPEQFVTFHQWLFENRDVPIEAAEIMAEVLIGEKVLPLANDFWVQSLLTQNMIDYQLFSQSTPVLPKLGIRGDKTMHGTAGGKKSLEDIIRESLLLK